MKGLKFKEMVAMFLILLFSYTASSKLIEHDRFVFQMKLSPLSPIRTFAPFLSWVVPIVELGITAILTIELLMTEHLLKKGLWASLILISLFEIYITAMLFSGKDLPCACGGIISLMSWKGHELFNGVTIILIATALIDFKKTQAVKTE
jgi:hypothetical protein